MSVKERPKKDKETRKKKQDESVNDWLDNITLQNNRIVNHEVKERSSHNSQEKIEPSISNQQEITNNKAKTKLNLEAQNQQKLSIFIKNLPSWTSKPWMFVKPTHKSQVISWLDSWRSVILDYARIVQIHVINVTELLTVFPFENSSINKQLTKINITIIIDNMVDKGLAKWIDENKILVRIYYKTNEEWSEIILKHLFETGFAAEVLTFYELEEMGQEWSTLPRTELREIFDMLVKNGRAKWVGIEKDTIAIII